jgi:predicted small lipoprotein YifL
MRTERVTGQGRRDPPAFRVPARSIAMALLLVAAAAAGCGKKGPPVAPERRVPAAVSAVTALVEGSAIVLSWQNPGTRADGTRLRDLAVIRVHRREEPGDGEPKPALLSWGKVVGYDEVALIRLAAPAPAQVEGPRVTWTDRERLTLGRRYVYVLTASDAGGRTSPPSARVVVPFVAAPRPPEGLTPAAGDAEVRLTWAAPGALVDGSPPGALTYEVLRGTDPAAPLAPVAPEPVQATEFADRGLANDQTYYYAVRAVRRVAGVTARSEPSRVAAATPADLSPPSPPRDLVAVPTEGAVRLAWSPSPEPDVAGYRIYRAEGPGELALLTPVPVTTTTYVDRAVERGTRYRYAVTALDRARRPNESLRSEPATVTVP